MRLQGRARVRPSLQTNTSTLGQEPLSTGGRATVSSGARSPQMAIRTVTSGSPCAGGSKALS
jgi:hypothetical protein